MQVLVPVVYRMLTFYEVRIGLIIIGRIKERICFPSQFPPTFQIAVIHGGGVEVIELSVAMSHAHASMFLIIIKSKEILFYKFSRVFDEPEWNPYSNRFPVWGILR